MITDLEKIVNRFVSRIITTDEQESELKALINEAKTIKQKSKLKTIIKSLNELEMNSIDNGSLLRFDPSVIDDVIEIIEDYI
ncbi:MAG: hypothetical protein IJ872_01635 [Eubacterium sp.]|nr:hypothetical protein [Eubacterium sp.]